MKTSLNILPLAYRRRRLIRTRLVQWGIAWAAAALLFGAYTFSSAYLPYQTAAAEMAALEEKYAPVKVLKDELESIEIRVAKLQVREAIILRLGEDLSELALLGTVSRAAGQSDGLLFVGRWQLTRNSEPNPSTTDQDDQPPVLGTLSLYGVGMNNLAIARFVTALRESGAFASVELTSTEIEEFGETTARRYLVDCTIR